MDTMTESIADRENNIVKKIIFFRECLSLREGIFCYAKSAVGRKIPVLKLTPEMNLFKLKIRRKDREKGMKKLVLVLILCMVVYMTAACGNQEKVPEETGEQEKTILEFYTWQDEKNYVVKVIDAFMEEYPHIKVNAHFIPGSEYAQTISVLHNTDRESVDVFTESKPTGGAVDVDKGFVKDITDLVEESWKKNENYGELLENLKINDRLFMLPYRKSLWAVFYNKKLFDQMEIPYPQGDWTWEDYTNLAIQMTGIQNGEKIYGSMSFEINSMWWRTPVRTAGMENEINKEVLAELKKAAQWYYQMSYDYQVQMPVTEQTDVGSYDYINRFLQGNMAMFYCGDWAMETIGRQLKEKEQTFEYDVAPLPGPDEGERYMPVTMSVIEVSSKSRYPQEAFALAEYLAGEKGAEILAAEGIIPAPGFTARCGCWKQDDGTWTNMRW